MSKLERAYSSLAGRDGLKELKNYHWRPPLYTGILSPGYSYNAFDPLLPGDPVNPGLVRIGIPLSTDTVLEAYAKGIFPWYEKPPVQWYSPPHRLLLVPSQFKMSRSFKKFLIQINHRSYSDHNHSRSSKLSRSPYRVTFDSSTTIFRRIIEECATMKRSYFSDSGTGTWITEEIKSVYTELFNLGVAHAVEVWNAERELVGGLYGLAIGKMFFGESMFHHETNCSKLALYELCQALKESGYLAIDCQVYSEHLESLGAVLVDKMRFLTLLKKSQTLGEGSFGSWADMDAK